MAGSRSAGKGDGRKSDGPVIKDPRFARLHSDPRFQRMPKSKAKVPIDARFQHMFSDKNFSDPHALDKRGRQREKKARSSLRRYYKVEEGEGNGEDDKSAGEEEVEVRKEAEVEEGIRKNLGKEKGKGKIGRQKRGEWQAVGSSKEDLTSEEDVVDVRLEEDESDISEASSLSSSDDESEVEEEAQVEEEENVPTTNQETRRFAIVNMDWQHIKAVDLLLLMKSFLPKGGDVVSVKVYPSEFGLQQMKKEERQGPKAVFEHSDEENDNDEIDMEKLRQYEKAKLRYYYAVVECDSNQTANSLYKSCDGIEFERTSNTLDMRFIPDEMEFKHPPRDSASEVPAEYKAPEFETRALQHSSVKLTWDDDEPVRVKALRRNFTADQLNEMDFAEYLASESEDEEDEEETGNLTETVESGNTGKQAPREKYRSLLLGENTREGSEKDEEDMEVTFHTGLDELSQRLLQKREEKQRGEETVWEAYLRKKKEKKSRGREHRKANAGEIEDDGDDSEGGGRVQGDSFFQHDEDPFDDPFFASNGDKIEKAPTKKTRKDKGTENKQDTVDEERARKREEKETAKLEESRSKAELELLLMDDHGVQNGVKGFNLRKQKQKGKKKNRIQQKEEKEDDQGGEILPADLEDPRFSSLFTSHHFAIEPTDPQFKRSSSLLGILSEKQRRRVQSDNKAGAVVIQAETNNAVDDSAEKTRKRKAEITALVHSLKTKVAKSAEKKSR